MAKREKNPASDKTGNDTGISLLVLGIVSVIFALWIPIVGIVLGTVSLVRVRKRNDLSGTAMAKAVEYKHMTHSIIIWMSGMSWQKRIREMKCGK